MATELIQAATILAGSGAGTWLADKLLGPSFDELGSHLQIYASDRLRKIFGRTKAITEGKDIEPLAPGFLIVALQRASVSEDAPEITEMWARLIASAASEPSNRQMIFVDILSQIGRQEAIILATMDRRRVADFAEHQRRALADYQQSFQELGIPCGYGDEDTAEKINRILELKHDLMGDVSAIEIINKRDGQAFTITHRVGAAVSYDILERQRLVHTTQITSNVGGLSPRVYLSALTDLGDEFMRACREASD